MKKFLTVITGATLVFMGNIGAAMADFPYLGQYNARDDINDPVDGLYSSDRVSFQSGLTTLLSNANPGDSNPGTVDNGFKAGLDNLLNNSYQAFFTAPETLLAGWNGGNNSPNSPGGLFGEYCKNGCCVNADCALDSIGWGLRIQCGTCGSDVGCWAECVRDKDSAAFNSALSCTSGTCPFSAAPGQNNTYACQQLGKSAANHWSPNAAWN